MAGDAENKRGYRTIFRSISQVFYANAKNTNNSNNNFTNNNTSSYNNNSGSISENNNDSGIGRLTVTLTSITPPTATWTSTSPTISTSTVSSAEYISCNECADPDQNLETTKLDPSQDDALSQDSSGDKVLDSKLVINQDTNSASSLDPSPASSLVPNPDQNQKLRASSMLDLTANHRQQNALRVSFDHFFLYRCI